jgi:hypothetical protein
MHVNIVQQLINIYVHCLNCEQRIKHHGMNEDNDLLNVSFTNTSTTMQSITLILKLYQQHVQCIDPTMANKQIQFTLLTQGIFHIYPSQVNRK